MNTMAVSRTLFRNAHNVPLKCFIQFDTAAEQVAEVKNLLEVSIHSPIQLLFFSLFWGNIMGGVKVKKKVDCL